MPRDYTVFDIRYPEKVRHVLLSAGSLGMTFHDLNQSVKTAKYSVADLEPLLNAWFKRRWVDKYIVTGRFSKQSQVIWRATRLLDTEWQMMLALVRALLVEGPPSEAALASSKDQASSSDQNAPPA